MPAIPLVTAALAVLTLTAFALAQPAPPPEPEPITTSAVTYQDGNATLEGYLAAPEAADGEQRPGVLIVHQWKGLGEFEKKVAQALAQQGYVAFALDIYGQDVRPESAQEAGQQAGKYRGDRALYRQRLQAGLDRLREVSGVDGERIAAIGFCFGGTGVLELARSGADVAGVVSFHGGLDTPNPEDANIAAKVLVLHGAADPVVPDEQVVAFMNEMREADVDWQLVAYGGAKHAFTEPSAKDTPGSSSGYHPDAARRSWADMRQFFDEIFAR